MWMEEQLLLEGKRKKKAQLSIGKTFSQQLRRALSLRFCFCAARGCLR
jgi:hypothetical protein